MAEWSAPVDRWVRRAKGRDGKMLGAPARLLLDDLWSKSDAPSKRDPDAHVFVFGEWVTATKIARDFECADRTIRGQLTQLFDAGLAKRGRGINDRGREVDGIWLANVPAAGHFDPQPGSNDPDQTIRDTGSNDPGDRKKSSEAAEEMIRDTGKNLPSERKKSSAEPDQMIRAYKEDPINPIKPDQTRSRASAQAGLFGDDEPVQEPTPSDPVTSAKIRAWWVEVYVPLRAETLDRYRPGSAQPIECSAPRLKALRKRIAETCNGAPWTSEDPAVIGVRDRLTHVVRNAAARVHEYGGKRTDFDWDSLDAIQPKHWSTEKNFTRYYEASPAYDQAGGRKHKPTGIVRRPMPEYSTGGDWHGD